MATVSIYYRPNKQVPEECLDRLEKFLPRLIGEQLTINEVTPGSDNIEMKFEPAGPRDKTIVDVGVTIFPSNLEERAMKLRKDALQWIVHHLLTILPDETTFYVRISLGEFAYMGVAPRTREEAEL
jgi:hypothetical protein